jgi:hypothetical protein
MESKSVKLVYKYSVLLLFMNSIVSNVKFSVNKIITKDLFINVKSMLPLNMKRLNKIILFAFIANHLNLLSYSD